MHVISVLAVLVSISFVYSQQSCPLSVADERFLKERRLQSLRANILAQLGMTQTTPRANKTRTIPQDVMQTFQVLSQAKSSMEEERDRKCQSDEFFAQPITTITGTVENNVGARLRRSPKEPHKEDFVDINANVLSLYKLKFDFQLDDELTEITRADLLLFQLPASKHDFVLDRTQYVEIKVVFETLGLKTVVAAKNIDIKDRGFQAFDITPAVKLWIAREIRGEVVIEVSISCLSSFNCAEPNVYGEHPAAVDFLLDSESTEHLPRLVLVSKNPIEVSNQRRFRRQATGNGVSFCNGNQSTCCLKPLVIDFEEDLGIDFVFMPKNFPANYCEGVCPLAPGGDLMTPEIFQFLTMLKSSPASSIEPCCAGNEYKPLIILMDDLTRPGNFIIEELRQTTVTSCRCA